MCLSVPSPSAECIETWQRNIPFELEVSSWENHLMWVKQCHKPLAGNGNHTTSKNGDDWGMVQMDVYGIVLPTL